MKKCRVCGIDKDLSQFYKHSSARDGFQNQCKECDDTRNNKYREKNREKTRKRMKEYHSIIGRQKAYERCLQVKYGITIQKYNEILVPQKGHCAICKTDKPGGRSEVFFLVDHDHDTGLIRGLLCHNCNSGLGYFRDDYTILRDAADYIEKHLWNNLKGNP